MLHKDYDRKGSLAKRKLHISGLKPQEAWHEDELIAGKPPVVTLTDSDSE
jgi:hypothetical protein